MSQKLLCILVLLEICVSFVRLERFLPILLWHSCGDSYNGGETTAFSNFIQAQLNNDVYIKFVMLDANPALDVIKSSSTHPFDQLTRVCSEIRSDPKLMNGYNGIGISQGGLFIRALAQVCPYPPMRNLITIGSPQQGVHRFPRCSSRFGAVCGPLQAAINYGIYTPMAQKLVAAATYWHDTDEERYRSGSSFLAIINNESSYNPTFVMNLNNLRRLILIKYERDLSIIPNSSTWFGFYDKNEVEYPMESAAVFDRLGLRQMKANGKLVLLLSPGDHVVLEESWFAANVIPYLMEP